MLLNTDLLFYLFIILRRQALKNGDYEVKCDECFMALGDVPLLLSEADLFCRKVI